MGPGGLVGVITVFRGVTGKPQRDELHLVTLYAGYASSAIERDRLLDQVTARNRVLETIREVLETLAGPIQVAKGLTVALQALSRGLQADQVALLTQVPGSAPRCRAFVTAAEGQAAAAAPPPALLDAADRLLAIARRRDGASRLQGEGQQVPAGAPPAAARATGPLRRAGEGP